MKTLLKFRSARRWMVAAVTILNTLALSPANAQATSEVTPEVRKELEGINKQIEECIRKQDMATLVDFYSDDATMMIGGGQKIQGRKAIAEYWYSLKGTLSMKSEILEFGGNGKIIYQVGKWTITSIKDGVEHTTTSDIVLVWKRQQNYDYKIQLNSANNTIANMEGKSTTFEAAAP